LEAHLLLAFEWVTLLPCYLVFHASRLDLL
jgi:hypothetical protein